MKTLLLILLLMNTAWARNFKVSEKECAPTDIRDHHPHLKEHFSNPQDQDSVGWCYGYTAADLLSVDTGEPVSAIHVSSIYNKNITKNPVMKLGYNIGRLFMKDAYKEVFEGGYISSALKDAMKSKEVCSDKNLPYYTLYSHEANALIRSIEAVKKSYKEASITEANACEMIENRLGFSMLGVYADKDKVIASLLNDNLNTALENLVRENCKGRMITLKEKSVRELSKPRESTERNIGLSYEARVKDYLKEVNHILTSGKPLGISYNVKHIAKKSGLHASTVIARRWNNGRCEYKIRNSWGSSCAAYKKEIQCESSEGTFWVNDETFFKMANGLTFISN